MKALDSSLAVAALLVTGPALAQSAEAARTRTDALVVAFKKLPPGAGQVPEKTLAPLDTFVDIDSIVIGPRELDLIAAEYMLSRELVAPFVEGYTKFLPLPKLADVRELYRTLWFLVWVLGEDDYDKWMQHDIWFD